MPSTSCCKMPTAERPRTAWKAAPASPVEVDRALTDVGVLGHLVDGDPLQPPAKDQIPRDVEDALGAEAPRAGLA